MQIVSSLGLFTIGLGLFAYIPGRFLLRAARIVVVPLDEFALSLNLGLILSALLLLGFRILLCPKILYLLLANSCFRNNYLLQAQSLTRHKFHIRGPHFWLIGTIL